MNSEAGKLRPASKQPLHFSPLAQVIDVNGKSILKWMMVIVIPTLLVVQIAWSRLFCMRIVRDKYSSHLGSWIKFMEKLKSWVKTNHELNHGWLASRFYLHVMTFNGQCTRWRVCRPGFSEICQRIEPNSQYDILMSQQIRYLLTKLWHLFPAFVEDLHIP